MKICYKYRLLPTKRQHAALSSILEAQRLLYNAALQERIDAYRKTGKSINFFAQCRSLTICRASLPDMAALNRATQEATLKTLDRAFTSFFIRVQKGRRPGFPRFKGKEHWRSFIIRGFEGLPISGSRLSIKGVPSTIRFHQHRPLPQKQEINHGVIRKDTKGWSVSFTVDVEVLSGADRPSVGIDMGLSSLAALSTGEIIPNARVAIRAERTMRIRQRALSRCKRGSSRRQKVKVALVRLHQKIANTRRTNLHQISARLTQEFGLIAVEKLQVANMVKGNLARSIHDAAWSELKFMLGYKAEKAGGRLIEVNPKFTSQDCSNCGDRVAKPLSVREHNCKICGLVLDRDINAAINILHKAKSGLEAVNVAQWSERRPRNIGGNI